MFAGTWCGGMGAGGWLVMALFWGGFLGLAVWAVTRLLAPMSGGEAVDGSQDVLDRRLATGELDLDTYRRLRDELAVGSRQ
jgi:putative membrane protein